MAAHNDAGQELTDKVLSIRPVLILFSGCNDIEPPLGFIKQGEEFHQIQLAALKFYLVR